MRIDRKAIQESELTMSRARQMAAHPGTSGFGFEANSPAELKQGLDLMKRQLHDMEAHRRQYELALRDGFVIAGFGGNLDGIEVPETLMTGKVPYGMTPEQAFNEVLDYMRKTIAALSAKLKDKTTKTSELPKKATKYLESKDKRIKEDRSLGRTPKPFDAVSKGTTVLEKDGEPWTVIEKGTVGELNRAHPECEIYERSYYHAVYVGDDICFYGHEDRGKHIFVYGDYDDVYNNVLAYYDDGPSRSWSVYMKESKNLKESEGTYLRTFFKFDDMLNENGELKQVDEITDWLQKLIDYNYLDNMWSVWFEDCDDTAAAAGIAVKTMPEILAEDPDAQFGYSYGSPDTRLCLDNAVDYVRDDGCDDWEHFGIKSPDDWIDCDDEDCYGDDEEYDLNVED